MQCAKEGEKCRERVTGGKERRRKKSLNGPKRDAMFELELQCLYLERESRREEDRERGREGGEKREHV